MSKTKKNNLEYYSNIRDEYQTQMINILKGSFYNGLKNMYQNVKQDSIKKSDRNIMKNFQLSLKNIPVWNKDIIDLVSEKVVENSDCNYLEKLLEVVYKSNYKLLSSQTKKRKKSNLEIPSLFTFIHKCYSEIAREVYVNPFLMCDYDLTTWELQSNLRETYRVIENSINNAIRKTLPFEQMIDFYLDDNESIPSELVSSDLSLSYTDDYSESDKEEEVKQDEVEQDEEDKEDNEDNDEEEDKVQVVEDSDDEDNKVTVVENSDNEEELVKDPEPVEEELVKDPEPEVEEEELVKDPEPVEEQVEEEQLVEELVEEIKEVPQSPKLEVDDDEQSQELELLAKELGKALHKDGVKVVTEEEEVSEKKFEKISNKKASSLNVVPNEKKVTNLIYTDNFDNEEIKKIKIMPTKKNRMLFFADADSD